MPNIKSHMCLSRDMEVQAPYLGMVSSPRRFFREQLDAERALERKFSTIDMNAAIARHPKLTNGMRWVLVEWLNQTVEYYGKPRQTFWLAVTLMDTFLSKVTHEVPVNRFQLLGCIFYWIAAKNEHGNDCPGRDEILQLLGHLTPEEQDEADENLISGECMVLNIVSFDLIYPSPAVLLDLYFMELYGHDNYNVHVSSSAAHYDMCCFLLDITTLDVRFNAFLPSERASAALYTARVLDEYTNPWDPAIAHATQVSRTRTLKCSSCIRNAVLREHHGSRRPSFVYRKYDRKEFHAVASRAAERAALKPNSEVPAVNASPKVPVVDDTPKVPVDNHSPMAVLNANPNVSLLHASPKVLMLASPTMLMVGSPKMLMDKKRQLESDDDDSPLASNSQKARQLCHDERAMFEQQMMSGHIPCLAFG